MFCRHAVIHNLSSKTHTETDKFIPDGKPKDPRQHIAYVYHRSSGLWGLDICRHTAVPKPSTEISTEDTSSPDWERRDPKQPEFTSYVSALIRTIWLRYLVDIPRSLNLQPKPLGDWKPLTLEGNGKTLGSVCQTCMYYLP